MQLRSGRCRRVVEVAALFVRADNGQSCVRTLSTYFSRCQMSDPLTNSARLVGKQIAQIMLLKERFNACRLALRKYGRHLDYCHLRHGDDCTCGLREDLEAAERDEHGT